MTLTASRRGCAARGAAGGRPGFTLIELLVVIAIIAVLLPLLLHAVHKVRQEQRQLQVERPLPDLDQEFLREGRLRGLEGILSAVSREADPATPFLVWKHLGDPKILGLALQTVDRDRDGRITPRELRDFGNQTGIPAVKSILNEYFRRFPLEPIDAAVAVRVGDISVDLHAIFTYEAVGALTSRYVRRPELARSLVEELDAAAAAEDCGLTDVRDQILGASAKRIRAEAGKSLTPEQAGNLIVAAKILYSRPGLED